MYRVKRGGKVLFRGALFDSYEQARCAVRRYIRQLVNKGKENKDYFGFWDAKSKGPTHFSHAFTIAKVA